MIKSEGDELFSYVIRLKLCLPEIVPGVLIGDEVCVDLFFQVHAAL